MSSKLWSPMFATVCRRDLGPFVLLGLLVFVSACSGRSTSGSCPPGVLFDDNGACRRVCERSSDCATCEPCEGGFCQDAVPPSECDPCDACTAAQVCELGQCLFLCNSAASCPPGHECTQAGTLKYCAAASNLRVYPTFLGSESQGANFRLRGGFGPVHGKSTGESFSVTAK